MRAGQGYPDEGRSARYVLKDYVNAKLLYCHPPPKIPPNDFNRRTHEMSLRKLAKKKHAPISRVEKGANNFIPMPSSDGGEHGSKSMAIDRSFFAEPNLASNAFIGDKSFTRSKAYPHQNAVSDDGTPLSARQARIASVMSNQTGVYDGKKHHKKAKRVKQRSGKGYD
jgi:large subunit GTPase 1